MKKMRASVKAVGKKNTVNPVKENNSLEAFRALRGLLIDQLRDIYWAEKALVKAIPSLIRNSSSDELVKALTDHLSETRTHVARLEDVFSVLEEKAVAEKSRPMQGLIGEAKGIIQETEKGLMRDAGIIATAQKVEHYEIATYGTVSSLARNLGEEDAAVMLYDTLSEEKQADEKLAVIAEDLMQAELINHEEDDDDDDEKVTETKKLPVSIKKRKRQI